LNALFAFGNVMGESYLHSFVRQFPSVELSQMPSGDPQRAWFPEMLTELQQLWAEDFSWDVLITFCSRMTKFRDQIWEDRAIRPPIMTCPRCGKPQPQTLPNLSPRSALFALRKLGVISAEETKLLERDWAKYRKENDLDAWGNSAAVDETVGATAACHSPH
jgi:hypothetical protein